MANYEKISARQARQDLERNGALLVCGYDDPAKWEQYRVPGAESFMDFHGHAEQTPKDQEVMFYCA